VSIFAGSGKRSLGLKPPGWLVPVVVPAVVLAVVLAVVPVVVVREFPIRQAPVRTCTAAWSAMGFR